MLSQVRTIGCCHLNKDLHSNVIIEMYEEIIAYDDPDYQ
jgi:hypothetical protein